MLDTNSQVLELPRANLPWRLIVSCADAWEVTLLLVLAVAQSVLEELEVEVVPRDIHGSEILPVLLVQVNFVPRPDLRHAQILALLLLQLLLLRRLLLPLSLQWSLTLPSTLSPVLSR
jgi:hypothetical protein